MPKRKVVAGVRESGLNIHSAAAAVRKRTDLLWAKSHRAPIFCKTKTTESGQTTRRTVRLLPAHTYTVAASGAAARVAESVGVSMAPLGLEMPLEKKTCAWNPRVSSGARMMLEQFLAALTQEAVFKAHAFREACNPSNPPARLTRAHMRAGWEATAASVFDTAAPVPCNITMPFAEGIASCSTRRVSKEVAKQEEEEEQGEEKRGKKASGGGGAESKAEKFKTDVLSALDPSN